MKPVVIADDEPTLLKIDTPQLMRPDEMQLAKRRAKFPTNRKGRRAFEAAERRGA
jgi:hypothetical protein